MQRIVVFLVMGAKFSNFVRLSLVFACCLASRSRSWCSVIAAVRDAMLASRFSVLGFPAGVAIVVC